MSPERKALFMCACHCQGGHSDAGFAASEALGVPFPITMPNLIAAARAEGANPATLWSWMIGMHLIGHASPFTNAEIKAAREVAGA